VFNKRYQSLPLKPHDFYKSLKAKNGILGIIGNISGKRRIYFASFSGRGISVFVSIFVAIISWDIMSNLIMSGGNLIGNTIIGVEVIMAMSVIFGFAVGWFAAGLFLLFIAVIAESVYQPLRYKYKLNKPVFDLKTFEMSMPYDNEIKNELLNYRKAVENKENPRVIDEVSKALKSGIIRKDKQKAIVDDLEIPFSDNKNKVFVPRMDSAELVEVVSAVRNIKKLAFSILLDDQPLLIGRTGIGKTSLIKYLAALSEHNFRRFNLNGQTDKAEFIGGYKPDGNGSFKWEDGVLLCAMRQGWWLVLDEMNLAESQVLERLNSLLDSRNFRVTEHNMKII
jgi:hypothetical protein